MPKTAVKKPNTTPKRPKNRKVAQPTYQSFRLSKRIKQPKDPILGSFRLFKRSIQLLINKWRLFGGIILVYLVLTVVLVKGFGVGADIEELQDILREVFDGNGGQLVSGFALLGVLLGNVGTTASEVAGAYQSMLLIITSLVLIWALRHTQSDKKIVVNVRDAFYKGLYPLVPFLLVLAVIGLQLVPLALVNFLYSTVFGGGLAPTAAEQVLWVILMAALVLLSLYMVTSSVFALYIVSLPDIRPMQALRSARELVRYRRWVIMRKVLFLPIALLIMTALIIVPLIILAPMVAEWLFFALSMATLAIVHAYMYSLYRELIK